MSKQVTSVKRKSRKGQTASAAVEAPGSQAIIGLHGLGRILEAVRRADRQKEFEEMLRPSDLLVHLDVQTARKIQAFVSEKVRAGDDVLPMSNNDNCDPRTDPWCINFLVAPH
ncbi:hypothetical protein IE4872_PC00017 (plasmid) [Rhizobium gallicum]|uniref:Uncharacterized protein n=2 Tax=Rhizobium gallicum TaxID=56730 RepID=A0A0B4XAC2_9HYPH|nr:hypothetical protein [Rhizobium gallicum]AJD43558.1 hypothetical protein RGR602_PB00016 [Rhizobium gallicum bv. gallicum R602sp]APO70050.1 hypothetical protein IE4872_PC00017 [Rhizobium gallicum]TDW34054.1 hypothetical protein EV128_10461 [Rhizobium azibense]